MSNNLDPSQDSAVNVDLLNDKENVRALSRSPHPYHRQKWELLEPSDTFASPASSIPTHEFGNVHDQLLPPPTFTRDSTSTTDSGTEADDENLMKRLPAPRARLHKGLRGRPEPSSGVATPLSNPTVADGNSDSMGKPKGRIKEDHKRSLAERTKRNKEVIRRLLEILLLSGLAYGVLSNPNVKTIVASWSKGMSPYGRPRCI